MLDELLEKPIIKQLSSRILKRKYDREKARRTREINRKRKAAGLDTFWLSSSHDEPAVQVHWQPHREAGKEAGKVSTRKLDAALETRIKEEKVDKKWINTETASTCSSGSNSKTRRRQGKCLKSKERRLLLVSRKSSDLYSVGYLFYE